MAIPIVIVFVIVIMIFSFAMLRSRNASKNANLTGFHFLAAKYMAQAGIQHAMMKIRLCPDEAFEAAACQYGICPLNDTGTVPSASGNGPKHLMDVFISDMKAASIGGIGGNGYEIKSIVTKSAFRRLNKLVTVVEITCDGWAPEGRQGRGVRHETVTKTVSIFKAAS